MIGEKNLPEDNQLVLYIARLIRNGFLIQSAYDDIDKFTSTKKLLGMIKLILLIYREGQNLIDRGILIESIMEPELITSILRMNQTIKNNDFKKIEKLKDKLIQKFRDLSLR